MKRIILIICLSIFLLNSCQQDTSNFKLEIPGFDDGAEIPDKYAMCIPDSSGKVEFSSNINPQVKWTGVPVKTKSLVLIFVDLDVPEDTRTVNVEKKSVSEEVKRREFYHWVLIDIPTTLTEIPEGIDSRSVTRGGKNAEKTAYGRRGLNDYTTWFRGGPTMGGFYAGYDGPCPPWNDEKVHRFEFRLYALDVPTLGFKGQFTAEQALEAMDDHVLAIAEWRGTYTVNQKHRSKHRARTEL
jgi:Raf kinase inhibitor-like YbhB/YbcL family protein